MRNNLLRRGAFGTRGDETQTTFIFGGEEDHDETLLSVAGPEHAASLDDSPTMPLSGDEVTMFVGDEVTIPSMDAFPNDAVTMPLPRSAPRQIGKLKKVEPKLDGETLAEVLKRHPDGLGLNGSVYLAIEIAQLLHDGPHGSLSSRTVFMCRDERIVLTGRDHSVAPSVYSAPEFRLRGFVADACADVFSLGVVLHEALTGRLPYRDSTVSTFDDCWIMRSPIQIRTGWRNLFNGVNGVLRRALAIDRNQRYPTPDAFLVGLRRVRCLTRMHVTAY